MGAERGTKRANEEKCVIWNKIGMVLHRPLEAAGTHAHARAHTHTPPHIFIPPSSARMANGSVKFPISFPNRREYPTFASLSLPLSRSFDYPSFHVLTHTITLTNIAHDPREHGHMVAHTYTRTRTQCVQEANVCTGCPRTLVSVRYESRIPNWTGKW